MVPQDARDLVRRDVVPLSLGHRVPELRIEKQLSRQWKLKKLHATLGALDPAEECGLFGAVFQHLALRRPLLPGRLSHAPSIGESSEIRQRYRAGTMRGREKDRPEVISATLEMEI
jgi:hypothetical protein